MPDPSYVIETSGRKEGLCFHLNTAFYPPLSYDTKFEMLGTFERYWNGKISIDEIDDELAERAGYTGGVGNYNFHMFLNEEDLNDD